MAFFLYVTNFFILIFLKGGRSYGEREDSDKEDRQLDEQTSDFLKEEERFA